jgi:hypothetical protein
MDKFTQVTRTSGLSNIGGSFKGVIFGFFLILGSIYLLWTNEGRAVHVAEALEEGAGNVKSISADKVDPTNEGKLVHVSGMAITKDTVSDEDFNVKLNALKLNRDVQIYQWVEKSESKSVDKIGGGTETTTEYTYTKEWVSEPIESINFKIPEGHVNTVPHNFYDKTKTAQDITIGAFHLSDELVNMITSSEKLSIKSLDTSIHKNARLSSGDIYIGSNSVASPEIGDLTISFKAVYPKKVSVVAKQIGDSFEEYIASNDETVLLLKEGVSSAENMFAKAIEGNKFKTWLLRLLGFILMILGFKTILKPFVAIGKIIPFIGNIVSMGTSIISIVLALPITLIIISLAWFAYRPILSAVLIAIGVGIYFLFRLKNKNSNVIESVNQSIQPSENDKTNTVASMPLQSASTETYKSKTVRITAGKLKETGSTNYFTMLEVFFKNQGIETFVAQEADLNGQSELELIVQMKSFPVFSYDAIELLRPHILQFKENISNKDLYPADALYNKEISLMKFIDKKSYQVVEEFYIIQND